MVNSAIPSATSPAPTSTSIAVAALHTIVMPASSPRRRPVESANAPSHGPTSPAISSGRPIAIDHSMSALPRPDAMNAAKYNGKPTPDTMNVYPWAAMS